MLDYSTSIAESNNFIVLDKYPTDYLKKLRKRDKQVGEYIGTNCPQIDAHKEGVLCLII